MPRLLAAFLLLLAATASPSHADAPTDAPATQPDATSTLTRLFTTSPTPLPDAPPGYTLRIAFNPPQSPTRIIPHPDAQHLLILLQNADVLQLDTATGQATRLLQGEGYAGDRASALGLAVSPDNHRLYIVVNNRIDPPHKRPGIVQNRVTIFRTQPLMSNAEGPPLDPHLDPHLDPQPWLRVEHPYGINAYNHGVSHLAFGPDGLLYVASGSRTDHGESGRSRRYSREGETRLTSAIWRLDPTLAQPTADDIEIYADGLRNPFGFAWDRDGRLFAVDHGPNAEPPGELNLIQHGGDYGFPHTFSNLTRNPYPDAPSPPQDADPIPPLLNVGPADSASREHPLATFAPHAAPCGMTLLGDAFGDDVGWFAIARFGALVRHAGDPGHDVLLVRPIVDDDGSISRIEARTFLTGVGRPIDVCTLPGGRLYVAEHSRARTVRDDIGHSLPGRILELTRDPR